MNGEVEEVLLEAVDGFGLRLDGDGALHLRLVAVRDQRALRPAVRADPGEQAGGVHPVHGAHHAGHLLVRAEDDHPWTQSTALVRR